MQTLSLPCFRSPRHIFNQTDLFSTSHACFQPPMPVLDHPDHPHLFLTILDHPRPFSTTWPAGTPILYAHPTHLPLLKQEWRVITCLILTTGPSHPPRSSREQLECRCEWCAHRFF